MEVVVPSESQPGWLKWLSDAGPRSYLVQIRDAEIGRLRSDGNAMLRSLLI